MTDAEELRKIIDLEQPDIIIPEIEAIATDALLRLKLEWLDVALYLMPGQSNLP